ncbi:hypothetical protein ACHRV5_03205 [Flavobacterium sp. FlaQc-52]|jgi:hypothetical protein|uniref:hypothetical protein n=1 Tax=Flavobacterium sp. FlaQc-52 TaxID=3374185 RepID=UPI0037569A09
MQIENIFLKDSLYSQYDLESLSDEELLSIIFYFENSDYTDKLKTLDSYCSVCKKETTFISKESKREALYETLSQINETIIGGKLDLKTSLEKFGTFERVFKCPRPLSDESHDQIFFFRIKNSELIKVGQTPSIADLENRSIYKYRALDESIYQEFNRAIGLASHGIGVGSFVYLRRIVEKHIVAPKLQTLIEEGTNTAEEIYNADFKKKIEIAKTLLPPFLVENKKIYSILSKGVHELEEQECRDFFPVLKTSIEIILDERIEQIEREKKNRLISVELNKFK